MTAQFRSLTLVRGEAPWELAPHLAGATLHALPKNAGDVRTIAVGEVWRRLASKCLCRTFREQARAQLWPLQVGVAVPSGAEAAVHTVRQWTQRNAGHVDKVLLKVDFQNAFNTVDRAALLRLVRLHLPGLSPWAEWCYDHHSRLLFHGCALTSEAGVQQGDPLAPLLFAMALQPALQAASSGAVGQRPELCFAFLDDGVLAGGSEQVASMTAAARQAGLQLRPDKCELVVCAGPDMVVNKRPFPAAGVKLNQTGAFSLLGAPIGPSRRVVYALRVTPPQLLGNAAAEVRGCRERLCTGPLPAQVWLQASLSILAGGLGLRHAARHATQLGSAAAFNGGVLPADHIPITVRTNLRQQQLSSALDRASVAELLKPGKGCEASRAHLRLQQQPQAGAWLCAVPSAPLGLHVAAPLFKVMVRLRLRLPVAEADHHCPLCDGVADRYGDHARNCACCGGDRTKRHNRLEPSR